MKTLVMLALAAVTAAALAPAPAAAQEDELDLHVGGAVRYNYFLKSWAGQDANRDKGGDFAFDTFRVNVDGTKGKLAVSAEYRFYAGYNMVHHGYVAWVPDDRFQLQAGVSQVPFGILPYASHNWFFDIGYYLGLEDDYDLGVKGVYSKDNWDAALAFYKNSEGSYTGNSLASARYSYDVVPISAGALSYAGFDGSRSNQETNQVTGRLAYTIDHQDLGSTEIGVSGTYGGLYNGVTMDTGNHSAAAAHLNGNYGQFNLMLEGIHYKYDPRNPEGEDNRFVIMGAYDAPYMVAAEGNVILANLSYAVPVAWGPISSLTFYDDYSVLSKTESSYEDSQQNVLGVLVAGSGMYTYVDFAMGKNQPWLGPDYGGALAAGNPDADWENRFNVNLGYYF